MSTITPLTRNTARRKIKQAADLCDNINRHLADVAPTYEKDHPDIVQALLSAGQVAELLRETLVSIRLKF